MAADCTHKNLHKVAELCRIRQRRLDVAEAEVRHKKIEIEFLKKKKNHLIRQLYDIKAQLNIIRSARAIDDEGQQALNVSALLHEQSIGAQIWHQQALIKANDQQQQIGDTELNELQRKAAKARLSLEAVINIRDQLKREINMAKVRSQECQAEDMLVFSRLN